MFSPVDICPKIIFFVIKSPGKVKSLEKIHFLEGHNYFLGDQNNYFDWFEHALIWKWFLKQLVC